MKLIWRTEQREISELIPVDYNPNEMTEKQAAELATSLNKFDIAEPIVINIDNRIIGGHQRVNILKRQGVKKIDVRVPDRKLNIDEEKELNIRLNKNRGQWNLEMLAKFDEKWLQDIGFEIAELDEIFGLENIDDEIKIEELKKEIKGDIKEGDIFRLGEHKIICGNSGEEKVWKDIMIDEKFDFMFTDPPYLIEYGKKNRKVKTVAGFGYKKDRTYDGVEKAGGVLEYDKWLSIASTFANEQGSNVMIFEYWKNVINLWQAIEKYWKIRNMVIWHTNNRCSGFSMKYGFFNKYDIALLGSDGEIEINEDHEKELENFLIEKGEKILNSYEVILFGQNKKSYCEKGKGKFGKVTDVITSEVGNVNNSQTNLIFGTKPLKILIPYVKVLSPRNGIVMEPYSGSGSTLIACEIMKRKCRAIELSETNTEITILRWGKFTGMKREKI